MTRRARSVTSRLLAAALIAALAIAAAIAGAGGVDPLYAQTTDYDDDNDGLIDIRTLAQLDAVRYDLDGNGDPTSAGATAYGNAFSSRVTSASGRMGCPSGNCTGYELRAHLDFDTNGNGYTYTGSGASAASDSGDDYHNGGSGWLPIGGSYAATFKGNGFIVSNLFIKRTTSHNGLFRQLAGGHRIESMGVKNAYVSGDYSTGALLARNEGTVTTSWSSGAVRGRNDVGGLIGTNWKDETTNPHHVADVIACYSHASVHTTRPTNFEAWTGGLIGASGEVAAAEIIASYSTGRITSDERPTEINGLVVVDSATTITDSYFDNQTSGRSDSRGQSTSALKSPTNYTGIYANWNVNVDGVAGNDFPWDFGTSSDYPVLRYGGMDPDLQPGRTSGVYYDYDVDNDSLIDISNLAQLDAVRYDLDGNGDPTSGGASAYNSAFPNRRSYPSGLMGCGGGRCLGYELAADLNFDTNGNGSTYTGEKDYAAGDPGDAYYNSGDGWAPIGGSAGYAATFRGRGYIISNLFVKRASTNYVGLFGSLTSAARVHSAGLQNVYVSGNQYAGGLAGVNRGRIYTSYVNGYVRGGERVGGLVGYSNALGANAGSVTASHARATVEAGASGRYVGGFIGFLSAGAAVDDSFSTGSVVTSSTTDVGGFVGGGSFAGAGGATITTSYWDTTTSGRTADGDASSGAVGRTTAQLQAPTSYTGIYSTWQVDVDADGVTDEPWNFGSASAYPKLRHAGMTRARQAIDYDTDGDGLIEIDRLSQLNAIRWDLNGDAAVASANASKYNAAFFAADTGFGCLTACSGYELAANLDFDTDGDGVTYTGAGAAAASDSGDAYHNGGAGWERIGDDSGNQFNTTFKGNGFIIYNLFIKRTTTDDVGLFGAISRNARVESLGVADAFVHARTWVGILAGDNYGTVAASWTSGAVRGNNIVGGLIGLNIKSAHDEVGDVLACYSTASVHATTSGNAWAGGLAGGSGYQSDARIVASYSTGQVTAASTSRISGLANLDTGSTAPDSYWNTQTSGRSTSDLGVGKTTAELQTPTGYTGIYANWNVNIAGSAAADNPWDFGTSKQFPVLRYGGMIPSRQRAYKDYDADDDGLIEIRSLEQLNAVRWDWDGDAVRDSTSDADWKSYHAAFPNAAPGLGCHTGCGGYELAANLDFDTDGDGSTYTGTGTAAASDPGDAYHNDGSGWAPFGDYHATFKGNGFVISNLFIKRTTTDFVGLFRGIAYPARVESLGLADAHVHGDVNVGILAGFNRGAIVASWTSGAVYAASQVGGLVGIQEHSNSVHVSDIIACYSHAAVNSIRTDGTAWASGLVGATHNNANAEIIASYSTGRITAVRPGIGGLAIVQTGSTIANSYWDSQTSGITGGSGGGTAQTTSALQTPTGYTGIYANWNIDVDGVAGNDDPWDFGTGSQYPALKYGGMSPAVQRGDYDQDDDGLIEIRSLNQLNAVRYDLDGNAVRGSTSVADWKNHLAAFVNADSDFGCPNTGCAGYELAAHLDFDTDGDGATYTGSGASAVGDPHDHYYNAGAGWLPIGTSTSQYLAAFEGNGYLVSNLFIKRPTTNDVGLFGAVSATSRIETGAVVDAYVYGQNFAGVLAGNSGGPIKASYTTGAVIAETYAGGLAGSVFNLGRVTASYSRASVSQAGGTGIRMGGLVGYAASSTVSITASYSTGTVTTGGGESGPFVGFVTTGASVSESYWDVSTTGIGDDADSAFPEGRTTAKLQSVLDYTDIYVGWNVDLDGAAGGDNPWDFGAADEYPVLKYGGHDVDLQRGGVLGVDYDLDDDGLIEITTLAQLDAVRWDVNGNGARDGTSVADWKRHAAAFPGAAAGFGCPSGCSGYELAADLDFDTDGDGSTYTGSGASATSDSGDAYHNAGAGWQPIGGDFAATFKGNGHVISNLFIKRTNTNTVGLFRLIAGNGRVESVGMDDAFVHGRNFAGALVGANRGTVTASWSDGAIRGRAYVGGLIGVNTNSQASHTGHVIACYSHASVTATIGTGFESFVGGLIGGSGDSANARITASYSTGSVSDTANSTKAGLVILDSVTTVANSYWDTQTSGITTAPSSGGTGQTTSALQSPTGYAGIYANWNVDVDGDSAPDDPWDFGTASDYPALKYGRIDYDLDDDGLIDITNLAQLDAIRHDLNGDGDPASGGATAYGKAFPKRNSTSSRRMGCPSGSCTGYELAANLDFDTDGDGATYTGTGTAAAGDPDDDYYNDGDGWQPIGNLDNSFEATFRGNGYVISNMFVKRTSLDYAGLFGGIGGGGRVESLGVENGYAYGNDYVSVLAGFNRGVIAACYTSGAVHASQHGGGVTGYNDGILSSHVGYILASYSSASVVNSDSNAGGLAGFTSGNTRIVASYATGSVSGTTSVGGLLGDGSFSSVTTGPFQTARVIDSYWDTQASGVSASRAGVGKTTAQMQNPAGYYGEYAAWDIDVDTTSGVDDPWDFGGAGAYPVLKYGGMDPDFQRRDNHDQDGDGLIEISSLAQLNAVRWDLDGDGAQDSTGASDWLRHKDVFPRSADDVTTCSGSCAGYELAADLNFDTDGDGATYTGSGTTAAGDSGDEYYNGGAGWEPLGGSYGAAFKGNGYLISNMFIKRATTDYNGLFGEIAGGGRVESMGIDNAYVYGREWAGALAGQNSGTVAASWSSGAVRATGYVGGLIGSNYRYRPADVGHIIASYSRASVHASRQANFEAWAGGLAGATGETAGARIIASYSIGAVTGVSGAFNISGLTTIDSAATIASAYWDTQTSGRSGGGGAGRTTAQLQAPTGYNGIFAGWNADIDGDSFGDNPWDFIGASAYPALRYGGMDVEDQRFGDYDQDGDGLIEINTLAQLDAMRHDPNGNGDATNAAYAAAFPGRITAAGARMGCPSGTCSGYELTADLDFDTDGDGSTYTYDSATETLADAAGDPDDAYYNGGLGWAVLGGSIAATQFSATFKGNGHVIRNLFLKRTGSQTMGLFGQTASTARIESLGVEDAYVYGVNTVGILAGANYGTIAASYTTGDALGVQWTIAGLVGQNFGAVIACYSSADASAASGNPTHVAGLVGTLHVGVAGAQPRDPGTIVASYSTGVPTSGGSQRGGLLGEILTFGGTPGTVTNSYWDTTTSAISTSAGGSGVAGRTTSQLQSPTAFTGDYISWNDVDVDGDSSFDDVWDLGGSSSYPVLNYGGHEPHGQQGDYDRDDDGLAGIMNLAQLNAVRWDLDGDAVQDSTTSDADWQKHGAAFPNAAASLGCPDTADAGDDPGPCLGYELLADLDMDANGDGSVDALDPHPGWTPLGDSTTAYTAADFDGNNYKIANLTINSAENADDVGLFGRVSSSTTITGVALPDVDITASGAGGNLYIGALVGYLNGGTIRSSYSTGSISQTGTGTGARVGGLTGFMPSGSTIAASWSGAHITASATSARAGGLTGRLNGGSGGMITASYATGAITATGASAYAGGLGGILHSGTVSASYATGPSVASGTGGTASGVGARIGGSTVSFTATYWDEGTTGIADDGDDNAPEGVETNDIQGATDGYEGILSTWNVDFDGQSGDDDPWAFGTWMQYPMLKWDGMSLPAQGSLAMGMPSSNLNHAVVGEMAGVCLVDGPAMRASRETGTGKTPWIWQRSSNGASWTDIADDGGSTWMRAAVAADENNYLRACVALNDTAPEGITRACVPMFGKTKAASGG